MGKLAIFIFASILSLTWSSEEISGNDDDEPKSEIDQQPMENAECGNDGGNKSSRCKRNFPTFPLGGGSRHPYQQIPPYPSQQSFGGYQQGPYQQPQHVTVVNNYNNGGRGGGAYGGRGGRAGQCLGGLCPCCALCCCIEACIIFEMCDCCFECCCDGCCDVDLCGCLCDCRRRKRSLTLTIPTANSAGFPRFRTLMDTKNTKIVPPCKRKQMQTDPENDKDAVPKETDENSGGVRTLKLNILSAGSGGFPRFRTLEDTKMTNKIKPPCKRYEAQNKNQ